MVWAVRFTYNIFTFLLDLLYFSFSNRNFSIYIYIYVQFIDSRHTPFEHIYRHHRRYRITEGAEELQIRRVAGYLFGIMKNALPKGVSKAAINMPGQGAGTKKKGVMAKM